MADMKRHPLSRDVGALILALTGAVSFLGSIEPVVELSRMAQWLARHWTDIVGIPVNRLLLPLGVDVPPPLVSYLLANLLPMFIAVGVGVRFFASRPASTGEARFSPPEIHKALRQVPGFADMQRRGILAFVAGGVMAVTIMMAPFVKISDWQERLFESRLYDCTILRDIAACRKLGVEDTTQIQQAPPVDWETVKSQVPYTNITRDFLSSPWVYGPWGAVLTWAVLYVYWYQSRAQAFLDRPQFRAYASRPRFLHALTFRVAVPALAVMAYARLVLLAAALWGLGSLADILPHLVDEFRQQFSGAAILPT